MNENTARAPGGMMLAIGMVLVGMISVQVGASFAKTAFAAGGAAGVAALRLALSTPILWLILRPWKRWPSRAAWRPLAIYGVVLGVMNLSFYQALARLPLGVAVAIEFLGPVTVALLASRRAIDFLWIGLAVAGLAGLLPITGGAGLDPVGVTFALVAALCWALYIWFGKQTADLYGAPSVAVGSLIAALLAAPIGFTLALPGLWTTSVLMTGLLVAVLSGAVPYTLEMVAMSRIPTKTFSILMSLEPVLGALAALVLLNERLHLREWVAVAAVMIASAGAALTAHRDAAAVRD